MNAFTTLPPASRAIVRRPERLIALSRVLDAMRDAELEATIELLIAMRDARDGDPDVEANGDEQDIAVPRFAAWSPYKPDDRSPEHKFAAAALADEGDEEDDPVEANGDERDGGNAEDDFGAGGARDPGAGCPISDPDFAVDDDNVHGTGDRSWTEWHTRGRHKIGPSGGEERIRGDEPEEDIEADGDERDAAWVEQPTTWPAVVMVVGDRKATEDDEAEEDHCLAGDDMVRAGPVEHRGMWLNRGRSSGWEIGDEADGERSRQPAETPIAANETQP